jgi:mRNA (2'-O-methyladenosine-N6-)-methyltransferase
VYLDTDLSRDSFDLTSLLPTKFDCILIDPPLQEYASTYPGRIGKGSADKPYWTWEEIANLPIPSIASNPGFIWLWVGSGKADDSGVSGLDKGREILAKWGYRRCEDIVWLRTNKRKSGLEVSVSYGRRSPSRLLNESVSQNEPMTKTLLTHTKEHCLMGIRGTVRRSTDSHFVHCNVDTDVIVWEGDEDGTSACYHFGCSIADFISFLDPLHKPPELYNLIENFCLGTRRLELFGTSKNLRPGWLTIGENALPVASPESASSLAPIRYQKEFFDSYFQSEAERSGANLVPTPAEIEALRPRSPGGSKSVSQLVPGVKSNPQGIGRHTNRSATPSASQQLEMQKLQQKQNLPQKPPMPTNDLQHSHFAQVHHSQQQHDFGRQMAMQAQQQQQRQQMEQQRQAEATMMMQAMMQQQQAQQAMNGGWQNPAPGMMGMMNGFSGPSQFSQMNMGMMPPSNMGNFPGQMGSPQAGFGMQIPQGYMGDMHLQQHMPNMMSPQHSMQMHQQQQQAMMGLMGQQAFGPGGQQFNNNTQGSNNYGQGGFY